MTNTFVWTSSSVIRTMIWTICLNTTKKIASIWRLHIIQVVYSMIAEEEVIEDMRLLLKTAALHLFSPLLMFNNTKHEGISVCCKFLQPTKWQPLKGQKGKGSSNRQISHNVIFFYLYWYVERKHLFQANYMEVDKKDVPGCHPQKLPWIFKVTFYYTAYSQSLLGKLSKVEMLWTYLGILYTSVPHLFDPVGSFGIFRQWIYKTATLEEPSQNGCPRVLRPTKCWKFVSEASSFHGDGCFCFLQIWRRCLLGSSVPVSWKETRIGSSLSGRETLSKKQWMLGRALVGAMVPVSSMMEITAIHQMKVKSINNEWILKAGPYLC